MIDLPREFFMQDAGVLAEQLLGSYFIRNLPDGSRLMGRIVETEAYLATDDPASHSYRGKTARNAAMFAAAGHLYVYFTYGMHFCCNVVSGREGQGEAVLLRALEPLEDIPIMAFNRYGKENISEQELKNLCRGPARLCQAFAIAREENGADLFAGKFCIKGKDSAEEVQVARSPRIGIREGRSHLLRFFIEDSLWLSAARKSNTL